MDQQKIYCRLEIFCLYSMINELEGKQHLRKEKSLLIINNEKLKVVEDYDVYVENYDNFLLVEARIVELYNAWLKFSNRQETHFNTAEVINDREDTVCISVMLYNRWGNYMAVGVCDAGWIVPYYFKFTLDYENNLKRRVKIDFRKDEKIFVIYNPQYHNHYEYECISKETAHSLIEEWLDTGDFTKYFFDDSVYFDLNDETDDVSSIPF